MKGFRLISAIQRGLWLIDSNWVDDSSVLIDRVLGGGAIGNVTESDVPLFTSTAAAGNLTYYSSRFGWSHAEENSIAVHYVLGPIVHYGVCGPGTSDLHAMFNAADANNNIIGHLFIFDTPGGQADGIKEFSQSIKASQKKKIGFIKGGMSASGGVWIMSSLDEVYASSDLVEVGSIGAYRTLYDISEKDKKEGIKRTIIRAKQSSDKNLIYEQANAGDPKAIALLQEGATFLAGQFIDWVSVCRADRLKSDDWKTGKMYSAQQAIEIGLIDGIASIDEVVTIATTVPKNKKNMKKFDNVAALSGKDQVSQDELDLANADLTTAGITHVTLVEQSVIDEASRVTEELATANTTIADNVVTIQEQTARISTLEGVIAKRAHSDNGAAVSEKAGKEGEIETDPPKKVAAHNQVADNGIFG